MRALGILVATAGSLIAILAPVRCFDLVLEHLIGSGSEAGTTPWQRGVAVVGALVGGWVIGRLRLSTRVLPVRPLAAVAAPRWWLLPVAGGAAYGCFSALWHCCPPLWWRPALEPAMWFVGLSLWLGANGRLGATIRWPFGELVAAVVFASTYPWHTPIWFAQCLVAGAFATSLVRLTGTGWSPALFLGTAYATHMTLPFVR